MVNEPCFVRGGVLQVAACDPDYDGPTDNLEWDLCTLRVLVGDLATIVMVSDGDVLRNIPVKFLRLPPDTIRKRERPESYSEEPPQERPVTALRPRPRPAQFRRCHSLRRRSESRCMRFSA